MFPKTKSILFTKMADAQLDAALQNAEANDPRSHCQMNRAEKIFGGAFVGAGMGQAVGALVGIAIGGPTPLAAPLAIGGAVAGGSIVYAAEY